MTTKRIAASRPTRAKGRDASRGGRRKDDGSDLQLRKVLHELQVHSEEITVQNEQLLKAQSELEQTRDRYADLYDFAPIGYVSIDVRASIVDINLAGAALLGRARSFLLHLPFAAAIVPEHLEVLRAFLIATRQQADGQVLQTEVRVRKYPERIVRLLSRPLGLGAMGSRLLTAMLDVTDERRLEAERAAALGREQARAEELGREVVFRTAAEERVKGLLQRLVTVQEEERRRIARNIHDHLGQRMTALRLTIGALKQEEISAAEFRNRFEAVDRIAAEIDRDVDGIAWDLRPAALDDVGLSAALAAIVRDWSETRRVPAEFHVTEPDAIRLPGEVESHLYRIVQEALNNVSKHATASRVSVLLEHRGGDVSVIVEDDGRGFDVAKTSAARSEQSGMGLTSIEERASLIGGHVDIESAPGKGTTVFVKVPARVALTRNTEQ